MIKTNKQETNNNKTHTRSNNFLFANLLLSKRTVIVFCCENVYKGRLHSKIPEMRGTYCFGEGKKGIPTAKNPCLTQQEPGRNRDVQKEGLKLSRYHQMSAPRSAVSGRQHERQLPSLYLALNNSLCCCLWYKTKLHRLGHIPSQHY